MRVEIAGFSPIGSEDRLSFGSDGTVEALVAQLHGGSGQSGISAEGPVPDNLQALIGGPLSASYGAQTSGPHPAPPAALADAFVATCASARQQPAAAPNPCLLQHGQSLTVAPTRAIGTEPFWGARIEGRCVTYSQPENPQGTRVWTRYAETADSQTWIGALNRQPFELRLRRKAACSDGMSDKTYPMSAELLVHGERRQGCAEPL